MGAIDSYLNEHGTQGSALGTPWNPTILL